MEIKWLFFAFALFLLTLVGVASLTLRLAVHPKKYVSEITPANYGLKFEEVLLTTSDNLKLTGWFVPARGEKVKSTIILLHGYPFDKGNLLPHTVFLADNFNLLFFDFRYFGKSQGKFTSLGFNEHKDVLAAIDYCKKNGMEKVGLMGVSLGGAVALLTLRQTNEVSAVVSDSSFANLDLLGETYFKDLFFLKTPLTTLTKIFARLLLPINPDEVVPEEKVKGSKIPIFIIHNLQDEAITIEHAVRLKKALADNPKAQFWFLERGAHGILPQEYLKEYQTRILEFFKQNL